MTADFPKAKSFIIGVLESLVPRAEQPMFSNGGLHFAVDHERYSIPYTREDLDDLEEVLDGNLSTKYSDGLESAIRMRAYIWLFEAGLIPDVKLSQVMLNEKRDWFNARQMGTHFDDQTAERLNHGLQTMDTYLSKTLQQHGEIEGVRKDLDAIRVLTNWYQNNKHMHFGMLDREALSFLKGAAVLAIADLEDKRGTSSDRRVKAKYNADILSMVRQFESAPYDRIRLPTVVFDYVENNIPTAKNHVPLPLTPPPALASSDIDELLRTINPRLVQRRQGAWQTLRADTLDSVSQAVNSMVEVLGEVIKSVRERHGGAPLEEILPTILSSDSQSEWVQATYRWITHTKATLQGIKHNPTVQQKHIAAAAMAAAELIVPVLLG